MMENLLASVVIVAYILLTLMFTYKLLSRGKGLTKSRLLALCYIPLLIHAYLLFQVLFAGPAMDISFFTVFSLIAWVIALLLVSFSWSEPIENLNIMVLPITGLAVLLRLTNEHTVQLASSDVSFLLELHIVTSLVAYSLLSIAALQSILLYIQDVQLHNKHATGVIRTLPPLETMERLLFRMIWVGFVVLCISLVTGFPFLSQLLSQHKTVLSLAAWVVFATLLWGRWKFGWRGRTAIRWTLAGFVFLLLAYFGSKFVLELVLHKQ